MSEKRKNSLVISDWRISQNSNNELMKTYIGADLRSQRVLFKNTNDTSFRLSLRSGTLVRFLVC